MKAKQIERLDRQRYWAVIVMAAGMSVVLFKIVRWCVLHWGEADVAFDHSWWWSLLVWCVGSAWRDIVNSRINSDSELKAALNNEMHLAYKYRSQRNALYTMSGALITYGVAYDLLKNIDARVFCLMVLFAAMQTGIVSWLVYNRR
jgi:hypothetical protein